MVERRLQGDFGVMQAAGIELHFGAARAAPEEIYGAALAHHFDGPLPRFRTAHRFNHHITASFLRTQSTHGFDDIGNPGSLNNLVGTHLLGGFDLPIALDNGNHIATDRASHLHEHQADRSAADDHDRVANLDASLVQAAQHAGQRLRHGRVFEAHVGWNYQHVGFDDALGHTNVFGVGAIVEQQIFAKIFLVFGAVEAHLAWSGVQSYNAHALLETIHAAADFFDHAGEFMSKQRRRNDHARVIAALVHLQIGAAGQRHLHFNQHLAVFDARDGYSFNLEIFFAVQHGSRHFSIHCGVPSPALAPQVAPG